VKILAFDLGRHTGWAVLENGKLKTGSYMARGQDEASVFIDWSAWVSTLVSLENPEAIAFEDVRFNRGRSFIPGMKALLYVKASYMGLTCFGVDVMTLKKFARKWESPIGKWTGAKLDMKRALMRQRGSVYGPSVELVADMDDNEVDAAWAAIWLDENATETVVGALPPAQKDSP